MKTIVLLVSILCSSLIANAQTETTKEGITITVIVNNATNNNGVMLFTLHNSDTFMVAKGLQNKKSKISTGKATVTFTNVTKGNYAIMVLHDENSNNQIDFDANGMPKEAYGMSNNPMSYGPPIFEDADFKVTTKNLTFDIQL